MIVPAWPNPDIAPPAALLAALRSAHAAGARIVGLCLGAFVLAEAGLLDGRTASTHWVWADDFCTRYPKVKLDRNVLFVDDGNILTSAGTAAAIDCCLHLLRGDHGAEVASRVARRMVVAPVRHGGQAQYIEQPLPKSSGNDALSQALDWAIANLAQPISLDMLADRAAMSRRNFTRRFKLKTGTTVAQWLINARLTTAQRLLEGGDQPLDLIADRAGLGSAASLRAHFSARFGISPGAYRKQFRSA